MKLKPMANHQNNDWRHLRGHSCRRTLARVGPDALVRAVERSSTTSCDTGAKLGKAWLQPCRMVGNPGELQPASNALFFRRGQPARSESHPSCVCAEGASLAW
jgi:hypothetical protein